MNFDISEKELENKNRWVEMLKYVLDVKDEYLPGSFSYTFYPTGIGTAIEVKYTHTNDYVFTKNITDYESW
jgi:hypothetical protein